MIYTSYGPNEDGTSTLVYTFPCESDEKAIAQIIDNDIGFCDLQEIDKPCNTVTIINEVGECIYYQNA